MRATKPDDTAYDTFVTWEYTMTDAVVGRFEELSLKPQWDDVTSTLFELLNTTGKEVSPHSTRRSD